MQIILNRWQQFNLKKKFTTVLTISGCSRVFSSGQFVVLRNYKWRQSAEEWDSSKLRLQKQILDCRDIWSSRGTYTARRNQTQTPPGGRPLTTAQDNIKSSASSTACSMVPSKMHGYNQTQNQHAAGNLPAPPKTKSRFHFYQTLLPWFNNNNNNNNNKKKPHPFTEFQEILFFPTHHNPFILYVTAKRFNLL